VDGNRRLAHGKVVGLEDAPCEIREMSDEEAFTVALVLNVQRSNVPSVGIGNWLQLMQMKFGYSQGKLAEKVGKSQSWVSRHLKLVESKIEEMNSYEKRGDIPGEIMSRGIIFESERQARALRSAPEDVRRSILEGASETGELPSGREIERKARAEMSTGEVLELYPPNRYDEGFVEHQLQTLSGVTLTEAKDILWNFENRRTKPRGKKDTVDRNDATVRVFQQLTRYYPTNLIDVVAEHTSSTNLETLIRYCRMLTQRMFEIAPEDLKQSALREFI
jgi:ParB-like chromosome segregation protein Spo0J